MTKSILLWIATLGPTGRLPRAPGTLASALGIFLALSLSVLPLWMYMGLCLILAALGIVASQVYVDQSGKEDPSEVVVDELVGQLIAATSLTLQQGWVWLLVAFLFFRLLDILKPFPISYFDQKVKGGVGVMADDIVAGIGANVGVLVVRSFIDSAHFF